jgi:hypothetical protein
MNRSVRSFISLVLLAWTFILATSGCSLFAQKQEPKRPRTVQEWIAQPRVQP